MPVTERTQKPGWPGGKLVLARPQNTVARVLNLVGADQLIPVYPSIEEAIGTPRS